MLEKLLIQSLNGEKYMFDVINESITVRQFKEEIRKRIGVNEMSYVLSYRGKMLYDDKPISYYNLNNKSILNLLFRLSGG